MDKIIDNINRIEKEIAVLQNAKGESSKEDIQIVAATKTRDALALETLYKDGRIKVFGENRVQELLSKYQPHYTWDFIGQLQTNKVKYIIDKVRLIHSVDREKLAKEIDKQAKKIGKVQSILMQINAGEEANKGGISVSQGEAFAKSILEYKNIELVGIMVVTPLVTDEREKLFLECKDLFVNLKKSNPNIKYLSMGMTNDYQQAIKCGSNMVRLGRVIFE